MYTQCLPRPARKESNRALPDITSCPEVHQIFKIRTVRKRDVFLPGSRHLKLLKLCRRKNPKKNCESKFDTKFVSRDLIIQVLITHTCKGKMLKM